uniref:NADH-ubiquinone oxidoreductase chain 6 n=1 Tax=Sebdenia flabellata TaxID=42024 RepID=A0A0E3DBD8_9FLOR|nr:NADH dehydrogenase subunit 6 [Sebdenia flabellata]
MNIDFLLFSFFSIFALFSSLMVINLKNAVHSVLFLILVFCNVAGLLLLLGAEFLSFMLLIVYVGAIAVLFLFVVMMLNVKTESTKLSSFSIIPIGVLIFCVIFSQFLSLTNEFNLFDLKQTQLIWVSWILEKDNITNVETIGNTLYTHYSFLFLLSGLILLVAMIGAIVLTMHQRTDVKKQKVELQLTRNFQGVIKFVTLKK